MINHHWWQVPLYVTCRRLTTSPIPYGGRSFQIDFDFVDHALRLQTSTGDAETAILDPRTVADFYAEVMGRLRGLGLETRIWTMPVELPDAIPFEQDVTPASYDPEYVARSWRVLLQVDRLLTQFRGPVPWQGEPSAFLLGQLRHGGHPLLRTDGTQARGRVAEFGRLSHAGSVLARGQQLRLLARQRRFGKPAFYSYAYPEPQGFGAAPVPPDAAYHDQSLGQHILPYDAVRQATSPDDDLVRFLLGTYEAAADWAIGTVSSWSGPTSASLREASRLRRHGGCALIGNTRAVDVARIARLFAALPAGGGVAQR